VLAATLGASALMMWPELARLFGLRPLFAVWT
jgi:hypothetical protein